MGPADTRAKGTDRHCAWILQQPLFWICTVQRAGAITAARHDNAPAAAEAQADGNGSISSADKSGWILVFSRQYGYILRNLLVSGDRMASELSSDQKMDEETDYFPFVFLFTILGGIYAAMVIFFALIRIPMLIQAYNYLAGARPPIDQAVLALLGHDNSRLALIVLCIIGGVVGLAFSHIVTAKLNNTRIEGEVELRRSFLAFLFGWQVGFWVYWMAPVSQLIDINSWFLDDVALYVAAGWSLGYFIPILIKYILLSLHARSINSHIELVGPTRGSGIRRQFGGMKLRVVRNDSEWS